MSTIQTIRTTLDDAINLLLQTIPFNGTDAERDLYHALEVYQRDDGKRTYGPTTMSKVGDGPRSPEEAS